MSSRFIVTPSSSSMMQQPTPTRPGSNLTRSYSPTPSTTSHPSHSSSAEQLPFPSCVLQARTVVFEHGVLGMDLLRLAPPIIPVTTSSSSTPSTTTTNGALSPQGVQNVFDAKPRGALSGHPIHALTTSPAPTPITHQAKLEPIYQAMLSEMKEKQYTTLSYSSWLHHSATYFNASPAIAKLYWQTFLTIHRSSYSPSTLSQTQTSSTPQTLIQLPLIRLDVDLQEFMLFLYLQRFRSFQIAHAADGKADSPTSKQSNLQKSFLVQNMYEILLWCRDSDRSSDSTSLTAYEFNRLALLIQGLIHPQEQTEIRSLSQLTPFYTSTIATSATINPHLPRYMQTSCYSLSINTLVNWISSQLNRPAVSVSLSLSSSFGGDELISIAGGSDHEEKRVDTLQLLPTSDLRNIHERSIFLHRPNENDDFQPISPSLSSSSFSASTSLSSSGLTSSSDRTIPIGGFVNIHHCTNSSFYFQLVSRFITLNHVTNSILHLGVVTHQLQIRKCKDCVIWVCAPSTPEGGISSNIQISQCSNLKIYLYTNGTTHFINATPSSSTDDLLAPLPDINNNDDDSILSNNTNITLAPYNTFYPELESDLLSLGLKAPHPKNSWNTFTVLEPISLPTPNPTPAASPIPSNNQGDTVPASVVKSVSIATGGRKSRMKLSHTSSSYHQLPLFLTFPSLVSSVALQNNITMTTPPPTTPVTPISPIPVPTEITLLSPNHFFPTSFPAANSTVQPSASGVKTFTQLTTHNPFQLPDSYTASLMQRQSIALKNRALIDSASLTTSQQHSLQCLIQNEFQAWLTMMYPKYYLNGLLRSDEERMKMVHYLQQRQQRLEQQAKGAQAASAAMTNAAAQQTQTIKVSSTQPAMGQAQQSQLKSTTPDGAKKIQSSKA